jgi:hypothetical protein
MKKRMNLTTLGALWIVVVLTLCIPQHYLFAQTSLRAEVAPQSGSLEDLFLFTVVVDEPEQGTKPQLATSSDFEVQFIGPRTTRFIANGVSRSQVAFVYQLTPKRAGTLKTPEVQIVSAGAALSAPPISVAIRDAGSAAPPSGAASKEPIFMNQTASPSSVYVGQQIVNSVTVFTSVNIQSLKIDDNSPDGFWEETISDGGRGRKIINGNEYSTMEIIRALFPLKSGSLTIPARKAKAKVPVRAQSNPLSSLDPFSDSFFEGFFQRTILRDKDLSSQQLPIEVKPLPPAEPEISQHIRGIPIVGATSLSVHYSDTPIGVGESKNISLIITSEGNLNPLKTLPLKAPPGVKLYDGQVSSKQDYRGLKRLAQKTFSFSAVPLEPGVFKIPGASLAYFDPDSASYRLITTPDISCLVTGTPAGGQSSTGTRPQSNNGAVDVGTKPTPVPTLPPLPIAPALTYREPSLVEQVTERVSVQLALLILSSTIAGVFLTSLALRRRRSMEPGRRSVAEISKASTLAELEGSLRAWAVRNIPGATPHATFDELRALLKSDGQLRGSTLTLLSLLDELELGRYGHSQQEIDITDLKSRLITSIRERDAAS